MAFLPPRFLGILPRCPVAKENTKQGWDPRVSWDMFTTTNIHITHTTLKEKE